MNSNLKLGLWLLVLTFIVRSVQPANAFETITFPSSDGLEITADEYLVDDDPNRPCIVLFHQSRWSRGEYRETAPRLNKLGFNCLAVDQRSGDTINGVINESTLRAASAGLGIAWLDAIPDMESAIAWTRERHPEAPVIGWGSSYSASLIIKLSGEQEDLVDGILSFSPGEYFSPSNLIRTSATGVKVPVFITSARNEENRWKKIFNVIPSLDKVTFIPKTSGNHGSRSLWPQFTDSDNYWDAVEQFLARWTPLPSLRLSPDTRAPNANISLHPKSHAPHAIEVSEDLERWVTLGVLSRTSTLDGKPSPRHQLYFRLQQITEEDSGIADVIAVSASANPRGYEFSVEISSPSTGRDHYADWWEVLTEDGNLLYRQIINHSETDDQSFISSGGPIDINPHQNVWVRAHMNTSGFGGQAFLGNGASGFKATQLPFQFAPWIAASKPLPDL